MKLKCPHLLKPLDTLIDKNYLSFDPSEPFRIPRFNMRHPVLFSEEQKKICISLIFPLPSTQATYPVFLTQLNNDPLLTKYARRIWEAWISIWGNQKGSQLFQWNKIIHYRWKTSRSLQAYPFFYCIVRGIVTRMLLQN